MSNQPTPRSVLRSLCIDDQSADLIADQVESLQRENAALHAAIAAMPTCRCGLSTEEQCDLSRENAALREDKDRLDWLANSLGWIIVGCPEADPSQHTTEDNTLADAWRSAIDAARAKEAKP